MLFYKVPIKLRFIDIAAKNGEEGCRYWREKKQSIRDNIFIYLLIYTRCKNAIVK